LGCCDGEGRGEKELPLRAAKLVNRAPEDDVLLLNLRASEHGV
jgi:hypothetical protein